jgi:hypothetical protein
MFKKIIFLLSFCLILTVYTVLAQEKETEVEKPRNEEAKPVETKRENETRSNDNSPRRESPPPKNENPPKREASNSDRARTSNKVRNDDSDETDKRKQDPNEEERRPKNPEKPPVEKPPTENPNNPVVSPNPPLNDQRRDDNQRRDKDKDEDGRDKDDKKRNRNRNNGGWGGYPYPSNYPSTVPGNPAPPFSMRDYFDKDDVFFDFADSYVEKAENYLPFFDTLPTNAFKPLYYAYGRKFFNNEFPWVSNNWTIYYEPDLDDIFVDFNALGNVKYERMVLYPIGDTIKKVNKKFDYNGSELRPVLVEKIPDMEQDKVYSFNVHDLPKGDYELRLIAKNGATVKHLIRLK